jgi:hypothetical protein
MFLRFLAPWRLSGESAKAAAKAPKRKDPRSSFLHENLICPRTLGSMKAPGGSMLPQSKVT